MRKLFARVTGSVSGSKRDNDSDLYSSSNSVTSTAESLGIFNESPKGDSNSDLIYAAAQSLLSAVQEILYDSASLQDNATGFEKLLTLLKEVQHDSSCASTEGRSSLDTLLINCKHPLFTEKCNEVGLATALMHALRLLRMYEIKLAKTNQHRNCDFTQLGREFNGCQACIKVSRACIGPSQVITCKGDVF